MADISTLDMEDFQSVRDRFIAFALCYDCALRIGEAARLRLNDVRVADFVEISLRGEVQKGSGKPTVVIRNLFPESMSLCTAYLRLRLRIGNGVPSLLMSETGKPLLVGGCQDAVAALSAQRHPHHDAGVRGEQPVAR